MHEYVGEVDPITGQQRVWIVDRPPRPERAEVVDLLAELRSLTEHGDDAMTPGLELYQADVMARIDAHARLLRLAEMVLPPQELVNHRTRTMDGFAWGDSGHSGYGAVGSGDLAYAILVNELGVAPDPAQSELFRTEVIARLPKPQFRLSAQALTSWIENYREIPPDPPMTSIGTEAALRIPALGRGPAASDWSRSASSDSAVDPAGADGVFESQDPRYPDEGDPEALTDPADDVGLGEATGSAMVRACEQAWADIQRHHGELPDVVMVLGTGVERGKLTKLGHWWGGRWIADGQVRSEVLLAGEALHLAPPEVFEVLLHESAHGLCAARGIKDTSRSGRYHNQRFAAAAGEVLLEVAEMAPYGQARTSLTPQARERYAQTIERLGEAMRIARQLDRGAETGADQGDGQGRGPGTGEGRRPGAAAATCGCGRRLRMAPSVLGAGPVLCGLCGDEFSTGPVRPTVPTKGGVSAEASLVETSSVETTQGAVVETTPVGRLSPVAATLVPPGSENPEPLAVAVLAEGRARLGAALEVDASRQSPGLQPLRQRWERLGQMVLSMGPSGSPPSRAPTTEQVEGAKDLIDGPQADPEVARWYERFGTPAEEPMPPGREGENQQRNQAARALLRADGTLRGPSVSVGPRDFSAGDRVVTTLAGATIDLPAGVLGTVEAVDVDRRELHVDFATWGRLRASVAKAVGVGLRHDYVEADFGTETPIDAEPTREPQNSAPGRDLADDLVAEVTRIDPGAAW